MICLLMVPATLAAIWAWRLADASKLRLKADLSQAQFASEKWQQMYNNKQIDLMELSKKHAEQIKWDMSKHEELEKLHDDLTTRAKHATSLCNQIEALRNEIEGLNIDKLALKERLQKFEADQQKRREQKRAGMARYRANKKEGKG